MFDELIRELRRLDGTYPVHSSLNVLWQGGSPGKGVHMTSDGFNAGDWIDRLTVALRSLAELQESYLPEYYGRSRRLQIVFGEQDSNPPAFPLDELRLLYAKAYYSKVGGKDDYYAPLCAVLDPVRGILRSHPTLAQVASPIIGWDEFWMVILNSGTSTSPADLIAGLMARAEELTGDRFRTAASELNAFLAPPADGGSASVLGELDVGYEAVLFYGLTVKERIDIGNGMAILPFEQVRAFMDENLVQELAPPGAGFYRWRSVGAVVKPFRWRPTFCRTGYERAQAVECPLPFFREAHIFLELLAVGHATPVLSLATLAHCIDQAASRLLGRADHGGNLGRGRSAQSFDGFNECPELEPKALGASWTRPARKTARNRSSRPTASLPSPSDRTRRFERRQRNARWIESPGKSPGKFDYYG